MSCQQPILPQNISLYKHTGMTDPRSGENTWSLMMCQSTWVAYGGKTSQGHKPAHRKCCFKLNIFSYSCHVALRQLCVFFFLSNGLIKKKEKSQKKAGNPHNTVVLRAKSFIALDLQRVEISASLSGETRTDGPAVRRLPSHSAYRHTRFPPLSYSIHPLCSKEAGDRL